MGGAPTTAAVALPGGGAPAAWITWIAPPPSPPAVGGGAAQRDTRVRCTDGLLGGGARGKEGERAVVNATGVGCGTKWGGRRESPRAPRGHRRRRRRRGDRRGGGAGALEAARAAGARRRGRRCRRRSWRRRRRRSRSARGQARSRAGRASASAAAPPAAGRPERCGVLASAPASSSGETSDRRLARRGDRARRRGLGGGAERRGDRALVRSRHLGALERPAPRSSAAASRRPAASGAAAARARGRARALGTKGERATSDGLGLLRRRLLLLCSCERRPDPLKRFEQCTLPRRSASAHRGER